MCPQKDRCRYGLFQLPQTKLTAAAPGENQTRANHVRALDGTAHNIFDQLINCRAMTGLLRLRFGLSREQSSQTRVKERVVGTTAAASNTSASLIPLYHGACLSRDASTSRDGKVFVSYPQADGASVQPADSTQTARRIQMS
jgi:hypothetical protein